MSSEEYGGLRQPPDIEPKYSYKDQQLIELADFGLSDLSAEYHNFLPLDPDTSPLGKSDIDKLANHISKIDPLFSLLDSFLGVMDLNHELKNMLGSEVVTAIERDKRDLETEVGAVKSIKNFFNTGLARGMELNHRILSRKYKQLQGHYENCLEIYDSLISAFAMIDANGQYRAHRYH